MAATFRGERNPFAVGPGLTGVFNNHSNSMDMRSPSIGSSDEDDEDMAMMLDDAARHGRLAAKDEPVGSGRFQATGWMEIWDYVGGASFRAFVADNGCEKSLFTFFDAGVVGSRDLKQALMALIELAEGPLDCTHIVICIDRHMPTSDAQALLKSLQWVGFDMTTLDHWARDLDVTSRRWLFMGMEV